MVANTNTSSTSSICQMADIARQFAIMKQYTKTTTMINIPSGYGSNGQLEYELDILKADGVLILKTPAHRATIDHVASSPEIYGTATKSKTTKREYIENGMINELTELYPYIIKMMQRCKMKDVKQEYKYLLFNNFSIFYRRMKTHGHKYI